jgi:hypothetical protein
MHPSSPAILFFHKEYSPSLLTLIDLTPRHIHFNSPPAHSIQRENSPTTNLHNTPKDQRNEPPSDTEGLLRIGCKERKYPPPPSAVVRPTLGLLANEGTESLLLSRSGGFKVGPCLPYNIPMSMFEKPMFKTATFTSGCSCGGTSNTS